MSIVFYYDYRVHYLHNKMVTGGGGGGGGEAGSIDDCWWCTFGSLLVAAIHPHIPWLTKTIKHH